MSEFKLKQTAEEVQRAVDNGLSFGESDGYILPEQELPYDPEEGCIMAILDEGINGGDTITIVYDGVSYICNTILDPETGQVLFGNFSLMGDDNDTGEPFAGIFIGNMAAFLPIDTNSHVIGIISKITKKIPAEYMEVRTFYVNLGSSSDPYIYTDAMCTTKATKEEVIATAKVQNFRLVMAMGGVELISMPVLSVPVSAQSDFRVYAHSQISGEINIYRTAEYVPETTE